MLQVIIVFVVNKNFQYKKRIFKEPQFEGEDIKAQRLDKADADYVECLHTSDDCYGTRGAYCHADFYANYGSNQPGCLHSGSNEKIYRSVIIVAFVNF